MTRERWSELSRRQQAAIVAAAVVQEALAAATLLDLAAASEHAGPWKQEAVGGGRVRQLHRPPGLLHRRSP
jgi:hypothetical protein